MKKKILFMVSSMNIGGVEKSLLSLLSVIPQDKYDITILTLEKKGGFLEYIPQNVRLIEAEWFKEIKPIIMDAPQNTIKRYLKIGKIFKIPSFIYSYYKAKKTGNRYIYYKNVLKSIPMNEEYYDAAIAYAGPTEIIDAYIGYKVNAKKKIAWVHFDISKYEINKKLYENLYNRFDRILAVSNEANKKLNQIIPNTTNRSEVFTNIVLTEELASKAKEFKAFDEKFDGVKILTVGRLTKQKGQDLIPGILKELINNGYNIKWYCIGEGVLRSELEKVIKEYNLEKNLILLGKQLNPYPYFNECDLYVQPSRYEGFCITLTEAKVFKKPIVITDFVGSEQISNNNTGIIVKCNKREIYNAIKSMIDDKYIMSYFEKNLEKEIYENTLNIDKLEKLLG